MPAPPTKRGGAFTVREIEAATKQAKESSRDVWLTDAAARGEGRFTFRATPAGARLFYYRSTGSDGKREVRRIGSFDPKGIDGFTLDEARREAGDLARLYQAGTKDLREHFERENAAKAAKERAKEEAASAAERKAKRGSLAALVDTYVGTLAGRQAEYDAGNVLRLHVVLAFPALAALPAAGIKAEQLRDVLARLVDDGKGRTAAKLRSYLRAAYGLAMRAGLDPTIPQALSAFDVETNPVDRLPSLSQFNKALHRALTLPELVAFWKRVQDAPGGPPRDALTAAVLLGGQRPTQLLRVTAADVDLTGGTVTMLDIKGRNRHANPRRHTLPIPDDLAPLIGRRRAACDAPAALLFGTTRVETVGGMVADICAAMDDADELERGPFSMRDLRRTAETHLAAMGVNSDVRAQLQSHGLGGVQQRHYDKHLYLDEKRNALALWAQRLKGGPTSKVVPIKSARKTA